MPDLNYEELNSEYIECFGKYMLVATTQLFEHTGFQSVFLKSHTFKPKIGSTLVLTFLIQVVL